MMTESDKERFSKRIIGELLVWDYLKNNKGTTDIGEDVNITEPAAYSHRDRSVIRMTIDHDFA